MKASKGSCAMILGAGLGTRLRPITDSVAKPFVPFLGESWVVRLGRKLRNAGMTRIAINLHHMYDMSSQQIHKNFAGDFHISYEPHILGTGGGIAEIEAWRKGQDLLVHNGDIVADISIEEIWRGFTGVAPMMVIAVPGDDSKTKIWLDGNRVVQIGGNAPGKLTWGTFVGIQVLPDRFLRTLPQRRPHDIIDSYRAWMASGEEVHALTKTLEWHDIGSPRGYWAALCWGVRSLRNGGSPATTYLASALTIGQLHKQNCSWVHNTAIIDTVEQSIGPEVIVEEAAHIGHASKLKSCLIMPHTQVPDHISIYRSIQGPAYSLDWE